MSVPRSSGAAAVILILMLGARTSWAEDLPTALSLEDAGRLSEALVAFEQLLEQQGNSRGELATIYLHLGLLRFASSDREGAARAFASLLAVDPHAELPSSAPPEVREALAAASERWGGRRLRADIEWPEEVVRGEDVSISVRVDDDVPEVVTAVAVVRDGRTVCDAWGGGPYELLLPASELVEGEGEVSINLLNEHDGILWSSPTVSISDWSFVSRSNTGGGSNRGLRIAGWVLLATGVVSTTTGGVLLGLDGEPTGQVREGAHEIYELGPAGWVLVGLGVASIITGIVFLLVRRGTRRSPGADVALRLEQGNVMFR